MGKVIFNVHMIYWTYAHNTTVAHCAPMSYSFNATAEIGLLEAYRHFFHGGLYVIELNCVQTTSA